MGCRKKIYGRSVSQVLESGQDWDRVSPTHSRAVVQPGTHQKKVPSNLLVRTPSSEFRSGLFLTTSCLYPVSPSCHFILSYLHANKHGSPRPFPQTWLLSHHFFALETTILPDFLPRPRYPAPSATSKSSLTLFRTHCSTWVVIPTSTLPPSCTNQLKPCLRHRACLNYSRAGSMAPGSFVVTLSWGSLGAVVPRCLQPLLSAAQTSPAPLYSSVPPSREGCQLFGYKDNIVQFFWVPSIGRMSGSDAR